MRDTPNRPQAGQLEQRAAPAITVDGQRLRGVIPYGIESRDLGGFRERMAPGCLRRTNLDDLVATVDHAGVPLARYPGTLTVEDRADGLHWSLELPESRSDVREAVIRGDLRASSWRMIVARDSWDGDLRTVEEVRALRDVAVVTTPAYPAATAELRSAHEGAQESASAAVVPAPTPNPQEAEMPPENTPSGTTTATEDHQATAEAAETREQPRAGLRVEDRTAAADTPNIETRVLDALRSVAPGEARSITVASDGQIAPPELSTFLFDRLRASSVALQSGIRVIATDRESIAWPQVTADMTSAWYAELDTITASDPTFATLEATPKKLAARVEMSNEVLDDSDPSILDVLNGHVATILGLKLDLGIFEGDQAVDPKGVRGLKFTPGVQEISMGTDGAALTDYDPVIEAVGLLQSANVPGPYVAVAHPRTATALALLRRETGSNEQLGQPAGMPTMFTSSQLSVTETKGTSSNASSAYVYSAAEVVLVRRQDATIELDRSRLFDTDASELRGKLRADLLVPNPVAVVRIAGITPA